MGWKEFLRKRGRKAKSHPLGIAVAILLAVGIVIEFIVSGWVQEWAVKQATAQVPAMIQSLFVFLASETFRILLFGGMPAVIVWAYTRHRSKPRIVDKYGFDDTSAKTARDLLIRDESLLANPSQYIRIRLRYVDFRELVQETPTIMLHFEVRNYLNHPIKVVRVQDSLGSVDGRRLPQLPQEVGVSVDANSENTFFIRLNLNGTKIPEFLEQLHSEKNLKFLPWEIKARWFIELNGSVFEWDRTAGPLEWRGPVSY